MDDLERAIRADNVPWECYDTLLRKGVIQELRIASAGALGTGRYVGFVFDRMFEFALAQRLYRSNFHKQGNEFEELLEKVRNYAAVWGASRVLIMLELEQLTT